MFKIVAPPQTLLKFINGVHLNLSEPQMRHVIEFMDALLACEGTKTIAKLNRLIVDATDQSAFTDFFTYSPWSNGDLRKQVQSFLINWVVAENKSSFLQKPLYISIDDSKNEKPKSSLHFEVTDWFFNTTEGRG